MNQKMSSPVPNEDQQHRKNTGTEDTNAMTVEFLRARLLSERSVSKSARQRANELARRVAELEEQLKFVSLQRKKAEKATADVLEILEKCGISDLSEGVDSCSDQDEIPQLTKDTSTSMKVEKNEKEAYSSSERDYSPSTARSLSWKSTRGSKFSLEKKKSTDSVRRASSFASNSSSGRRVGKSCRRIRRRETRSLEELQNDGPEKVGSSRDVSNCSDGEHYELGESVKFDNEMNPSVLGSNSETTNVNDQYFSGHERDGDMESALRHQAQLIGKYEAEEKAQREWEEKFRENNSGTQDSCDPGNHSDVTEEQYEIKSPRLLSTAGKLISNNQETRQEPFVTRSTEGSDTFKSPLPTADKRNLQDEKCSGKIACESSASEFSFQMSKDNGERELSRKHLEVSLPKVQQGPPMPANLSSHHVGKSMPQYASPVSSSSLELAVVPQETSNNLGSVLEALQRAKLSLNQKLNDSQPMVGEGTSGNSVRMTNPETNMDAYKVPVSIPGLFRLPTDNQFKTANHLESSFANVPPEIAGRRYLLEPLLDSRNAFFGDLASSRVNHSVGPSFANFSIEPPSVGNRSHYAYPADVFLSTPPGPSGTWSGVPPMRSLSQPRLAAGPPSFNRNQLEPYTTHVLPSNPDIARWIPSNEGTPRNFSSSEAGLPPITRLSLYDDLVRKSMHR